MDSIGETTVVVWKGSNAAYPELAPFHPELHYPEYIFSQTASQVNVCYEAVRSCFCKAALDYENYGTPQWNPLKNLIYPGETVLLKPNLVKEDHPRDPYGWIYTITNGSIIRAVADYVWKAVGGEGKIIVADSPQTDSSLVDSEGG